METKNLIRMANDIGSFFVSYPDEEQAKKDEVVAEKTTEETRLFPFFFFCRRVNGSKISP